MTAPSRLAAQIARLPSLPWVDLKAEYHRLFGQDPPVPHRRFVERRVAYKLQEVAYRQINPDLLDRNAARIEALLAECAPKGRSLSIVPGTVLTREYDGRTHHVVVQGDGRFEYAGAVYASLSVIARQITGTRWSGPVFFGLRRSR